VVEVVEEADSQVDSQAVEEADHQVVEEADNQAAALLQEDLPSQPQHQPCLHWPMEKDCMEVRQASSMALGTRAMSSSRNLAYIT
jgi:hypothetical protein